MSAVYNLEPQPGAKVVLKTTAGEILLEIFSKQTPLTSRNFLQLCLDGYYDGTIFHRLVPGFIIQGGDPTGTGEGGEAIYDRGLFADEFHSRLKFNRRGLLGMANGGQRDDNGSQFFLTLGKAEELNGRNTMFGRVEGETIYNLIKMGEADVGEDGSERPLYPTRILGTEVLVNPFDDLVPRVKTLKPLPSSKDEARKKLKKKSAKILLSFGADDTEEPISAPAAKKAKFNTKLIDGEAEAVKTTSVQGKSAAAPNSLTLTSEEKRHEKVPKSRGPTLSPSPPVHATKIPVQTRRDRVASPSPSTTPEPAQVAKVASMLEKTNAQIAELKASMRRRTEGTQQETRKLSALEAMIPKTSMRGRKRKHGGAKETAASDRQALDILQAFQKTLDQAPPPPGLNGAAVDVKKVQADGNDDGVGADDDEEAQICDLHFIANCQSCRSWDYASAAADDDNNKDETDQVDGTGWMSHALSFEKDRLGKDLTWRRKNEEELVVIDPREKVKSLQDERRTKRENQANGGTRAWDRDRPAPTGR
ncbi:MAG: hypothetical protein M1825_005565 [Sarcosagium campestre]|nr:MAG: hypothetical protein M1825_005565 [Sarcosagium campestre]